MSTLPTTGVLIEKKTETAISGSISEKETTWSSFYNGQIRLADAGKLTPELLAQYGLSNGKFYILYKARSLALDESMRVSFNSNELGLEKAYSSTNKVEGTIRDIKLGTRKIHGEIKDECFVHIDM